MKATDVLMNEHRVIEQVLGVLEEIAARAELGRSLDLDSAREAIDFFRTFADGCHHQKEERHLFPMLEAVGMAREHGPTGVMLHEHRLGRGLLAGMEEALDEGSPEDFAAPARAYVALMRAHIWKEDDRLFRMADRLLGPIEDVALLRAFDATEHADMGEGTHENYLELADRLADRFGVRRANAPVRCGGCCSGHHSAAGVGEPS